MTEGLAALLERTADDWCRGALPPPLPHPLGSASARGVSRRPLVRILAPALAAAAVVAVVVPLAVVAERAPTARPMTQVDGPVRVEQGPRVRFLDTDAGLPVPGLRPPDPHVRACTPRLVTAVLDLAASRVTVTPQAAAVCLLPDDVRVTLPDDFNVVQDRQPDVPNPPEFGGRFVESGGVALNARWTGRCDRLPDRGELVGTAFAVQLAVTGTPPACGDGDGLRVGPAHTANGPGAVVPADRADLVVTLQAPAETPSGSAFDYSVTIANPTGRPVSLRPCPTFKTMYRSGSLGFGDYGRVPCENLPDRLLARQQVVLTARASTPVDAPRAVASRTAAQLTWSMAGTDPATGSVDVVQHAPIIVGVIPYKAPNGRPAAKSTYRYDNSAGGTFPVVISGPATVRVGETLHYKVVFTNPDAAQTVPLGPCPDWTELMAQAPKVTNRPKIVERSGPIDCAHAPKQIGPGEQVTFEMERPIGADTPPGAYQLYWQFHNGLVSAPFDLDVLAAP